MPTDRPSRLARILPTLSLRKSKALFKDAVSPFVKPSIFQKSSSALSPPLKYVTRSSITRINTPKSAIIQVKGLVSIAMPNFIKDGINRAVIVPATTDKKRIILFWFLSIQFEKSFNLSISHLIAGETDRIIFALKSSIVI